MVNNDRAQWLLLSSVVVSFGIVALLLLLNTAMLAGHSTIESVMDFPKAEIRDLRSTSLGEAVIIGHEVSDQYDSSADRVSNFRLRYDKLISDLTGLYERQGIVVDVRYSLIPKPGETYAAIIEMTFYDGNTVFVENQTVRVW